MRPAVLSGFGSSDDDEDLQPQRQAPSVLVGFGEDSDEDEPGGPMARNARLGQAREFVESNLEASFLLSQSGAFKLADFRISPEGLEAKEAPSPDHAHPSELGSATACRRLDVHSLDDLEMLDRLGSGASGTVYRARHLSTGTHVAVKCVTILEKAKRDQVVSELRIMMTHALGARWLVAMHNAFYEEAKVYTVIELMDAGSLEDLVRQHSASGGLDDETKLAWIARELLGGLNYLHRQLHQVHRDLKPANCMLSSNGAVKISDFGISSQLDSTSAQCNTFVGTTCYMSPERLTGEAYSYAADIWAFGLIMFELATGKYPYPPPASIFQLLAGIMDNPAPTLPAGNFSNEFAELISVCLDKTPTLRPTARDLLKHPWFREQDRARLAQERSRGAAGRRDERHEGLDRSRSRAGLDVSSLMDSMSLRESWRDLPLS